MRVELHNEKGVLGEIVLKDGIAVGSNALAQRTIDDTLIVTPGKPPQQVKPGDGEAYLKALPLCLRGSYFWAELQE